MYSAKLNSSLNMLLPRKPAFSGGIVKHSLGTLSYDDRLHRMKTQMRTLTHTYTNYFTFWLSHRGENIH